MPKQNNFFSKSWVIKVGGSLLARDQFADWVKSVTQVMRQHPTVLVHGGGKEITELGEKLGVKSRFVSGRRFTDDKIMSIVEMVLSGKVNPRIVSLLNSFGVKAVGLSGVDGKIVQAEPIAGLGLVGKIKKIETSFIQLLLEKKYVPVFASCAVNGNGQSLNINADEMACALASRIQAENLILFTDKPGILDDRGQTIDQISLEESKRLIQEEVITGGMIPKVESAFRALKAGVKTIWILEGKLPLKGARGTVFSLKESKDVTHPFKK